MESIAAEQAEEVERALWGEGRRMKPFGTTDFHVFHSSATNFLPEKTWPGLYRLHLGTII
jgi:hypothetical protein